MTNKTSCKVACCYVWVSNGQNLMRFSVFIRNMCVKLKFLFDFDFRRIGYIFSYVSVLITSPESFGAFRRIHHSFCDCDTHSVRVFAVPKVKIVVSFAERKKHRTQHIIKPKVFSNEVNPCKALDRVCVFIAFLPF